MNNFIKQSLIIVFCFFLILWFQDLDDKKNKKTRDTLYDKYKIPILVCSIIGLLLTVNLNEDLISQFFRKENNINLSKSNIENLVNPKLELNGQNIYTDLPDF